MEEAGRKDATGLAWEELSREHIIQNRWIDFRKSRYRFPDGSEFEPYYSYSRRDYAVIVAMAVLMALLLCSSAMAAGTTPARSVGEVSSSYPMERLSAECSVQKPAAMTAGWCP